jgi:two-component system nitrate/nitrite sensor histidine kinase NarX
MERKRVELQREAALEALRASEERYRVFVGQSSEAIWRLELDVPIPTSLSEDEQVALLFERGYVAECNDAMARMHGFANAEEAIGSRLGQLMPRLASSNVRLLRAFIKSGYRVADVESSEIDRQGGVRHFSNNLLGIVEGEPASLVRLWGVKRDVTARREIETALRRARDEMETLQAIGSEVASNLQIGALLTAIAERMKEVLDYTSLAIFRLQGYMLTVAEYRGPLPREEVVGREISLPQMAMFEDVVTQRRPIAISDVLANSPLARSWRERSSEIQRHLLGASRSWLAAPLVVKNRVIGVLRLGHDVPNLFGPHEAELALAFANHAAVAMENARLYEQARALAILEERQRLARDLHDAVSQTLFSASLIADVLPRLYERNPQRGQELLAELRDLSRGALAEMRTLLIELRPQSLLEVQLDVLLQQLALAAAGRSHVEIEIAAESVCPLPDEVQMSLYRIAQEALNNVAKHSDASRARVVLRCIPGADGTARHVTMTIEDNGCGFDLDTAPADRFGLSIMAERADSIAARLTIDGRPGEGTLVAVEWGEDVES